MKKLVINICSPDEFFLHCDPHYTSHKNLPQPPETAEDPASVAAARKHFQLPEGLEPLTSTKKPARPRPGVKIYDVVDELPNPVWSSNVVSREEFVDHDEGTYVFLFFSFSELRSFQKWENVLTPVIKGTYKNLRCLIPCYSYIVSSSKFHDIEHGELD